jgi:dTDP-glucose pyrophosphorylase
MISNFFVRPEDTIEFAMKRLDDVKGLGLIVVDTQQNLIGTLTDGDFRRAILSGKKTSESVASIVFKNPFTATKETPIADLNKMLSDKKIKIIPILDARKVVDVFSVDADEVKDIPVIIMAGGLGSRLGEFTKDIPKPMLDVGGKPVLERIIHNFTKVGFSKFYLSINYKAEVIENYFKDGSDFLCDIKYIKETKRLGTAGSLSLLPENLEGPMIVTNGDLLTLVDFRRLISFHQQHKSSITMCTRKFEFQVPFGVVNIQNGKALSIDEKPNHVFNVSAGVYVINASLLKFIPKDEYFDMPSFLHVLMKNGLDTECFPLVEQWIDIGQVSDLNYARSIYGET